MDFIQQGYKGETRWYWYLITLFIVFIFWQVIGIIPISLMAFLKLGDFDKFMMSANDAFASAGLDSNFYLFLMLFSFVMGLVGLLIGIRFIHGRLIKTVVTSRSKIDWQRVFFAFGSWFLISVIILAIGIFTEPENLIWNFKPIPFFTLVVISLLFLPLQTSFEELLFRGYLMQGLGVLAKNRWFPLLLTSVVFGLLHGANPEVAKLGNQVMIFYIGTGLLFGITTLMDEGAEIALGMHAANNIIAALFVTTDWTAFQTAALYIDTSEPSLGWDTYLPVFVLYPMMLIIFSRKYGWTNWSIKLFGKVEDPQFTVE
ncbi:MAG: CPBP family intramembrane metalloprotease [Flavobacteriaceae bacterium]|nr:CPBP family intramembrane metalloprotease [Flavobacteriaceae bacterium]